MHAHHGIAEACRDGDAAVLRDLAEEVRGENRILLSSELFAGLTAPALERLHAALFPARFEVIHTLRRLPELLPSHWKEMVKHGLGTSLEAYLSGMPIDDPSGFSARPSPLLQLQTLSKVFGAEQLRIWVYEEHARGAGFGTDFARDFLGAEREAHSFFTSEQNFTPPAALIALIRLVNLRASPALDATERRQIAQRALHSLSSVPPIWFSAFLRRWEMANTIHLSNQTPWIAAEQAEVVLQFGAYFIDATDAYLTSVAVDIPVAEASPFGAEFCAEIDALFDTLRIGV